MKVYVFGNPDMEQDSLPLKILPDLKKKFPDIKFEIKDPNEEWNIPEELLVIDTVLGIKDIKIFDDLKTFVSSPQVSMHDFDALANLRFLQKLGKLKKIKIIGVPPTLTQEEAFREVSSILPSIQL